ncbi:MAG: carboxypeptidase-like regulatory domain-containing protein [Armatimonadota bacterium]
MVVLAVEEETSAPLQVPATIIVGGVRGELRPADEQLILRDVPIGSGTPPTQALTATAEGFVTKTQQVQMQVTTATWVTVALKTADPQTTGTVAGTVDQQDTTDPVVNAFVRFTPPDDGEESAVGGYTDSDGRFVVGGIPAGERAVTVQAEGYLPFNTTTEIVADADGDNEDLQFELIAGDTTADVAGVVVDVLTRKPIEGAEVTVADAGPVQTGPEGRFVAADVLVGDQTVKVSAEGFEELTTDIRVLPGLDEITLELFVAATDPPGRPFTLTGTVTLDGPPDNSGAIVTARSLDTGSVIDEDETPASGRYELFMPPGRYELTVTVGEKSISREVTVPEGGVAVDGVDFVLTVQ